MTHSLVLSQKLDCLAKSLAKDIALSQDALLQKKWILVPSSSLKEWLVCQLAFHLPGFIGYRIASLEEFTKSFLDSSFPTETQMVSSVYNVLEKRVDLSFSFSSLFFEYGKYLLLEDQDFQIQCLNQIVQEEGFRFLKDVWMGDTYENAPIYCFGFDFLPPLAWSFLIRHGSVFFYAFSPCMEYWGDVSSDRERRALSRFWERKKASLATWGTLENAFLKEPPLLANLGKLGRETNKILDEFDFTVKEEYELSEKTTLLSRMQKDILSFETSPLFVDDSISICKVGSSLLREVENLYQEILFFHLEKKIPFSQMTILAPNIEPYIPLIESLFSHSNPSIPYRLIHVPERSSFRLGLEKLLSLAKKWSLDVLISLFENKSFSSSQRWDDQTKEKMVLFLKEIFSLSSDWKEGIFLFLEESLTLVSGKKTGGISLSEIESFEEFSSLLRSLYEDLQKLLEPKNWMDFACFFEELQKKYLSVDEEEDSRSFSSFLETLQEFKEAFFSLKRQEKYPFDIALKLLQKPLFGSIQAGHLHAIRIGSIEEGNVVPSDVLFLIGMDEESFPRKSFCPSMNLLNGRLEAQSHPFRGGVAELSDQFAAKNLPPMTGAKNLSLSKGEFFKKEPVYVPDSYDVDRYLFLKAFMNVSSYLRMSYRHLSLEDGSEVSASLVVQDLLQMLPFSICRTLPSEKEEKLDAPCCFCLKAPVDTKLTQDMTLSLSDLVFFARHPWRYYLEKVERLFLKRRFSPSFMMKRSSLLRSSLDASIDVVLEETIDESLGLFKEAFSLDAKEKYLEREGFLREWGQEIQAISFLETAGFPKKTGSFLEIPPIEWEVDGYKIRIVGDIPYALQEGALYLGDDKLPSLLKSWPEILATLVGLQKTNLYFLKTKKVKSIEDPLESLKKFTMYYLRTCTQLSPLISDWADVLLRNGESFPEEIEDIHVNWVLERLELPSMISLKKDWEWLSDVFSGLISLYPSRKESHATV